MAVQPSNSEAFMAELKGGFADQDIKKHKFEMQDGSLAATGYVLAQTMTGRVLLPLSVKLKAETLNPKILRSLLNKLRVETFNPKTCSLFQTRSGPNPCWSVTLTLLCVMNAAWNA